MRLARLAALPAHVFLALTASSTLLAVPSAEAQQPDAAGPPAFLTFPRLGLLDGSRYPGRGHLVWTGDGFAPAPFVHAVAPGAAVALAPRATTGAGSAASINVSNDSGSYEGETGAASNGVTIVGGSNSIFPGACGSNPCYVKAYTSSDGNTWTATQMSGTWAGKTFGISFDPALDHDLDGNYYFVFGGAPLRGSYPNSIAVAKADASGLVWSAPVAVTFNRNRYFDDKYYIAVDRSPSQFQNRIYVAWDRNTSTDQILYVASSSDAGATWSAPVKVDDGTSRFERVIGAYPAVDQSTGTVYASWHNYAQDVIYVDKSTSGGASWGTDVAAATTHTGFGVDIGCNGGREQSPAHHLKVGPSGTLHLVYADAIQGRGFDILYTRSTDGGAHWSAPVRLNDDAGGAHQYHPTLSVTGGTGGDAVSVTFYDRRDDAANCLTHVYATASSDGGLTWSANTRLTTAASNFDGNANGPGDYSSSTSFQSLTWPFHSQHPDGGDAGAFEIYAFPF
ncbi:MAG TPA: sialidase family protein [Usitatibacter sp.]|nr:sialidase family protein [Usitatibacter sp.]